MDISEGDKKQVRLSLRQIDGVLMGSPWQPTSANIFVGFHEKGLLSTPNKPVVYFCYVDDMFCLLITRLRRTCFLSPSEISIQPLDLY